MHVLFHRFETILGLLASKIEPYLVIEYNGTIPLIRGEVLEQAESLILQAWSWWWWFATTSYSAYTITDGLTERICEN